MAKYEKADHRPDLMEVTDAFQIYRYFRNQGGDQGDITLKKT